MSLYHARVLSEPRLDHLDLCAGDDDVIDEKALDGVGGCTSGRTCSFSRAFSMFRGVAARI
jgi:hypothetical protein